MDAVYILGTGSLVENEEIRYSIRSLVKNMRDLGSIFVIGDCPDFLPGVVHILADDLYDKPWKNMLHKTRLACANPDLSDEFLLMNDDFFMLTPFDGADFSFYAMKNGSGGCNGKESFQIHCPIRFNKDMFLKLPINTEMKGDYSPRSFYSNFYTAPPLFVTDFIIREGVGLPDFTTQIKGRDFFSISNSIMLNSRFQQWLFDLYPERCSFEE